LPENQSAVIAADLVRSEKDSIGIANDEFSGRIATSAEFPHHPARRAVVQIEIWKSVEHSLQSREVFGVATHVSATMDTGGILPARLPHGVMFSRVPYFARSVYLPEYQVSDLRRGSSESSRAPRLLDNRPQRR